METKDQDWPYLNKYRKENAAIDLESGKPIVFMGDSITEFWYKVHPEFFRGKSYKIRNQWTNLSVLSDLELT
jgi:hypothetical protein